MVRNTLFFLNISVAFPSHCLDFVPTSGLLQIHPTHIVLQLLVYLSEALPRHKLLESWALSYPSLSFSGPATHAPLT